MKKTLTGTKAVFIICLVAVVLSVISIALSMIRHGTPAPPDNSAVPILLGLIGSGIFAVIFGIELKKEKQAKEDDPK